MPATSFSARDGTYADNCEPTKTAIKLESTSAPDDVGENSILLVFCAAANKKNGGIGQRLATRSCGKARSCLRPFSSNFLTCSQQTHITR